MENPIKKKENFERIANNYIRNYNITTDMPSHPIPSNMRFTIDTIFGKDIYDKSNKYEKQVLRSIGEIGWHTFDNIRYIKDESEGKIDWDDDVEVRKEYRALHSNIIKEGYSEENPKLYCINVYEGLTFEEQMETDFKKHSTIEIQLSDELYEKIEQCRNNFPYSSRLKDKPKEEKIKLVEKKLECEKQLLELVIDKYIEVFKK